MIFKESTDYTLIEKILKEPHIFKGLDWYNKVDITTFKIPESTHMRFFIINPEQPLAIAFIDNIEGEVKAHFAVTRLSREIDYKASDLIEKLIKSTKIKYPRITAFKGSVPVENESVYKLHQKIGTKTVSFINNEYQMKMEL